MLDDATPIGLGLIVKEDHPEAPPGSSGRDQNQIEDFDVFLLDAASDDVAMSWHYADQGSSDATDDAYFSGFFEESVVAAGSYYLSFRIPGYPSPGAGDPRGGSVVRFDARHDDRDGSRERRYRRARRLDTLLGVVVIGSLPLARRRARALGQASGERAGAVRRRGRCPSSAARD